jgi:hypothetical protein
MDVVGHAHATGGGTVGGGVARSIWARRLGSGAKLSLHARVRYSEKMVSAVPHGA